MPVQKDRRRILKLFSVLLAYPDEQLLQSLDEVRVELWALSQYPAISPCNEFVKLLGSVPLISMQERYTNIFDLRAETCLNLTYHEHGENPERGVALANFRQLYKTSGYEQTDSELPDYLPIVLEFLSLCADEVCSAVLRRHVAHLEVLASRLKALGDPYQVVMEALCIICRQIVTKGV
ncbi:MAG: nitrate reductase molybdenum cofactor assembly chaperone [Desulfomonilaceae bacterium]